jgi:diadenosine tetraphosphate (Ap4A) HIT family hydrolase
VSSVSCVFCVVIHLHVISRFRGDGFGFHFGPEYARLLDRSVLDQVALDIR